MRAADPVDPATIPSATDAAAQAMRERIVMGQIEPTPTRSRVPMIAVAATLAALVADACVVLATRGTDQPAPGNDPITPGGQARLASSSTAPTR